MGEREDGEEAGELMREAGCGKAWPPVAERGEPEEDWICERW